MNVSSALVIIKPMRFPVHSHFDEAMIRKRKGREREPIENMEGGEKLLLREKGSLALEDIID